MAITLVTSGVTGTGFPSTLTLDTTGADLLVMMTTWNPSFPPSISDNKGNTFTQLTVINSDFCFYYVKNPTVGSGHVFTVDDHFENSACFGVSAFAGTDTTSPFDQQNGNYVSGSLTIQPGSITPSSNNEVVVAGAASGFVTGVLSTSDVTVDSSQTQSGSSQALALGHVIQTTATAINPTWTSTNPISFGDGMHAVIASFKAAGGGGGGGGGQIFMEWLPQYG